jgi:hypothetical protein
MNRKGKKYLMTMGVMVLVHLSICSILCAQFNVEKQKPKVQQPKEHLKLILEPVKTEFASGESIDLRLRMKNMKTELLTIVRPSVEYDLKGWILSGEIRAPDGAHKVVHSARRTEKLPDPASGDILRLKPGEEVTLEIRLADKVDYHRSTEPWDAWTLGNDPSREGILKRCFPVAGEYRMVVSVDRYTEFLPLKGGGRTGEVSAWRGKISSNPVKIRVTRGSL